MTSKTAHEAPTLESRFTTVGSLEALNTLLAGRFFRAGWNKAEPSLWKEPRTSFVPEHWRWSEAKAALDAAGALISTDLADRRNLFMVNPHDGNHYATLRTLVAAYQMIGPGETARSHRHSPHALRLVLEAEEGAYTVVDGVRIDMRAGDVLLTPGGCWHGHGNEGTASAYWIDVLDVPTVQLLEPMFLEHWSDGLQSHTMAPAGHEFIHSWDDTNAALNAVEPDPSGRYGARVELERPGWMPTMSLHMQRMSAGFKSRAYRTTANQIVCVRSGRGVARVRNAHFTWRDGDVFVVPTWHEFSLDVIDEAVLFTVSDEKMQRTLQYLRVEDTPQS